VPCANETACDGTGNLHCYDPSGDEGWQDCSFECKRNDFYKLCSCAVFLRKQMVDELPACEHGAALNLSQNESAICGEALSESREVLFHCRLHADAVANVSEAPYCLVQAREASMNCFVDDLGQALLSPSEMIEDICVPKEPSTWQGSDPETLLFIFIGLSALLVILCSSYLLYERYQKHRSLKKVSDATVANAEDIGDQVTPTGSSALHSKADDVRAVAKD